MSGSKKNIFRHELTPQFAEAARHKKPGSDMAKLLHITEAVRSEIIMPASKKLDEIVIEVKETGDGRQAAEKTFSIKTDHECEALVERKLKELFPDALVVGEERFGIASLQEKIAYIEEIKKTERDVFLVDALDGTRDFRTGGDGHSVIIVRVKKGEVVATVVHRNTDHADIEGTGHTITFEKGDGVRINGRKVKPLSERSFPSDPKIIRGYACYAVLRGDFDAAKDPARLRLAFDSLSDAWTCATMYTDLLKGQHHFMLVDPPADMFDYPSGMALIKAAGGVARFMDGKEASVAELLKRQAYGKNNTDKLSDILVLAVSEEVFTAVQKTVLANAQAPQFKKSPLKKAL